MKIEFYGQIFEIHTNIRSHKNLCSGSRVFSCLRTVTDRLDEANIRFPLFASAPDNLRPISQATQPSTHPP